MFSKSESTALRKEFWICFGKSFPRKWVLYNTKIKGIAFKFQADRKKASVCFDFESPEDVVNELLYERFESLKKLLLEDLPDVVYDDSFLLDNGKIIHRIYIPFEQKFSIHNKDTWRDCYEFFYEKMEIFENFYLEYEDVIKQKS